MREHIQAALAQTRGRVSGEHGAALLLKVNANTLRAKMRKLKIKPREFKRSA
jgi:DNA-binding NtrC family response regulator